MEVPTTPQELPEEQLEQQPEERERPAVDLLTTYWRPQGTLKKGEALERAGVGFPAAGFDFSKL